jgi:hypothetical protein
MSSRAVLVVSWLLLGFPAACTLDAPPEYRGPQLDARRGRDAGGDGGVANRTPDAPAQPPTAPPPAPPQPPSPPPPADPVDAAAPMPPDTSPDAGPLPPPPPPPASGLTAHWKFDEGSGDLARDSSGSANDGTLGAGATFVVGGFPGALFANPGAVELDGVEGRVVLTVNRLPPAEAPKSISFWANHPAVPADIQAMVSLTNGASLCGVQIGFRSGQLTVWGWAGAVLATAPPPPPGWHNIIYTFDGFTHTLVVDGVREATTTDPAQSCPITDAVVSGYAGGAENFLGTLDDLRIYDRALTDNEVTTLAAGGQP